ncbi:hypothetical protein M569_15824, partial [Genlisea aurea]
FLIGLLYFFSDGTPATKLGICYGELGNNLPPPSESVRLIEKLKAGRVKIYDANPEILKALKGKNLLVSVMLPNQLIPAVAADQKFSDEWVRKNVAPFYPATKIRYILVGNEILSNPPNTTWFELVPAMKRIRISVVKLGMKKIKIGTPLAMDVLESSYPPSAGAFRSGVIADDVIKPLLRFLNRTKSFFFVDVYPYFAWVSQPLQIKLDYALLQPTNTTYTDPGSGLRYTNLLDQMLDAVVSAMAKLGFPDIRLFVAETGWPNAGNPDQLGANIYNAATYNRNAVKKFSANPPVGIPSRPGAVIPATIFALFNENKKPGPGTERHFGQLYPDGKFVYPIDLSGKTPISAYPPLRKPASNGRLWCVVANGVRNATSLTAALTYACGNGNGTCDGIRPGGKCFRPDSLIRHASYGFSSYWAQFSAQGATCSFNGLATLTSKDPSYGYCKYPSVNL